MAHTTVGRAGAAIDIGSNSVHMLVARATDRSTPGERRLRPLVDRSELIGLGDVVDAHGAVPGDARALLVDVVATFQTLATAAGARRLTVLGTEPLRRASNAAAVAGDLRDSLGVELQVITVEQEARLTFLGVTEGQTPTRAMMVVDIGGGSTEVCLYRPDGSFGVAAIPIGSARLTAAHIENDPPTEAELRRLRGAVDEIHDSLPPRTYFESRGDVLAVFVGGTATNVARLGRLTRAQLAEDLRTLAEMDAAHVMGEFGVRPRRARQLAAGVAIVDVLLEHFGLDEAVSSEASLRDGAIIADWRFGDEWPERLGDLFG